MLGFHAEGLSEAITIDPEELADARWFSRAQCLDPAWIDNRRRLAGKPWMRGDRRYAIAERRRSISCASLPWCVLRQPLPTRRRVGAERQSVQRIRQQLRV